jgi:homoserine dehydrogenase
MSKIVRLSILGAGTVGGGVLTLLRENADLLQAQTGKRFEVRHVLVRDPSKPRAVAIPPNLLTTDPQRALCDPKVHVVLELMGGLEPARTLIRDALQAGKHVITANKWVMAVSGDELLRLARRQGVRLLYEASVAGSLPILNALQGALAGNRIERVVGIVNSTTNFILREMERALDAGEPAETAYASALRKAQENGYAEADPTSDVEGYDAQYKTAILARLAFLQYVPLESVYREGITRLSGRDLLWARRLGMGLKLLSISERLPDGRLCARVHPTLIPRECPLVCGARGVQRRLAAGQRLPRDVAARLRRRRTGDRQRGAGRPHRDCPSPQAAALRRPVTAPRRDRAHRDTDHALLHTPARARRGRAMRPARAAAPAERRVPPRRAAGVGRRTGRAHPAAERRRLPSAYRPPAPAAECNRAGDTDVGVVSDCA